MGYIRGQTWGRNFICRRCGGVIRLVPRPGFIVKGQPKNYPVNSDDGTPHGKRCRLLQDLERLKSESESQPSSKPRSLTRRGRSSEDLSDQHQGELFDAEA